MKRTLFSLLIATTLLTSTAQAQETKKKYPKTTFGIQAGANMSKVTGTDINGKKLNTDFITGFHGGVNVEIPLGSIVYLQPGLQFITKGAKKKSPTSTETHTYYYAEMPINFLFKPQVGKGHFIVGVGANIGYGVGGKWKYYEAGTQNDKNGKVKFKKSWNPLSPNPDNAEYLKPIDVGVGLIVGYQLGNNLFFQLNGQYGVINTASEIETTDPTIVQPNAKNVSFGFSMGFRF
jgi:hypothetical protein